MLIIGTFKFGAFWTADSTCKYLFAVVSTEDKLASLNEELERSTKRDVLKNTDYLAAGSMTKTEARLSSSEDQFNAMSLKSWMLF
jgi:hypothetical protein